MLPRVSAALAQLVAPVVTSSDRDANGRQEFQRQKKPKRVEVPVKKEGTQPAPVIELRPDAKKAAPLKQGPASVPLTILQLLDSFRAQHSRLAKLLGLTTYVTAAKTQRSGKIKKGAMIDHRAA